MQRGSGRGRNRDGRTSRAELTRLREEARRARQEAEEARAERDRLLARTREVNENLVVATIRAHELAEEAEAARAAVLASEERFRSLVTTSAAIVFVADAAGRIDVAPESWRAVTGMPLQRHEDEPGWGWLRGVHPDERDRVRDAWLHAVATGRVYTHQHRLHRRDGSWAWVVARAVPVPRAGPVREWIGMMTDISDRIRIEEAREQFIAILGHDLRNPLGAILMGAEMLAQRGLPEPEAQAVARIGKSAHRMEAMIRDVLDFARGRLGGGIPIRRQPCDLGRICDEEAAEMRQLHPGRVIFCDVVGQLTGDWDPDRLEQALANLIDNAVQHGLDPIQVMARPEGDEVVLAVRNAGPPIAPAAIPRLFEPFRRRPGDRAEGLGLGLYIVSEIVRAHAGTISVVSSEDAGTTFTVRLPRREAARGEGSPLEDPPGDEGYR